MKTKAKAEPEAMWNVAQRSFQREESGLICLQSHPFFIQTVQLCLTCHGFSLRRDLETAL